jgi:hypothetical protein
VSWDVTVPTRELSFLSAVLERLERDGEAALTTSEQYFLAVDLLESALMTGGTEEYLLTCTQQQIDQVLAALTAIGAPKTRQLLEGAWNAIRDPLVGGRRQELPIGATSRDRLGERFVTQLEEYPDHLRALNEAYAATHDGDFLGPRTHMELWVSRRQRGAQTAPRRMTVVVSPETERERDASLASRSCPVCGYPSPDYRRTCKACGFPHGRKKADDT